MDIVLVALVAAAASALTLFSGFGLGTLLLPAFALFFPAPLAVAATGIVHLANNLFKGALLRKGVDWRTVARFGLPAVPAAIAGAWVLTLLGETARLFSWDAFGQRFGPTGASLTVGSVMMLFAVLEFQAWFQRLKAPERLLPVGGLVTGFFGGLTGQQGALRSIFLLRSRLSPEHFIATGVLIAILIDVSRLMTYARGFRAIDVSGREGVLVVAATLSAMIGAFVATRFLRKMTIGGVRRAVAGLLLAIGAAMAAGLVGGP